VESKLTEAYSRQFFYIKYGTKSLSALAASWTSTTTGTNTNTGYFAAGGPLAVGDFATSNLKYAQPGSLIKFTSPDTREFLNGRLVTSGTDLAEDRAWAKVSAVVGDGSNDGAGNLESGIGPITLNDTIPAGAVLSAVFPKFATVLDTALKTDLQDKIEVYEQFGLRYDEENAEWKVITAANLSASSIFSLANAGDATGASLDASWWFRFSTDCNTYTVTYISIDYIATLLIRRCLNQVPFTITLFDVDSNSCNGFSIYHPTNFAQNIWGMIKSVIKNHNNNFK
jgi:hypothetical protein